MSQVLWQTFHFYGSIFFNAVKLTDLLSQRTRIFMSWESFLSRAYKEIQHLLLFQISYLYLWLAQSLFLYVVWWILGTFFKELPSCLGIICSMFARKFQTLALFNGKLIHILKSPLNVRFCSIALGIHGHCHIF